LVHAAPRSNYLTTRVLSSWAVPSSPRASASSGTKTLYLVTLKKARLDERVAHGAKAPQLSRQNEMTVALRNIGQIERPLFSLEWLQDVELRRPRPRPAQ
jgi:hypothetical protein